MKRVRTGLTDAMTKAAGNGADILLLPEAFITGYRLPMSNDEALPDDNPYLRRICEAAGRLHIGVVAPPSPEGRKSPGTLPMSSTKAVTFQ